jgi:hypothetical protein
MDTASLPLCQGPDEQRLSFDLLRRLLATIDQWGNAQPGKGSAQLDRVVMDGLLQTVTAICISRELSGLGITPEETQAFFRRIYKGEGLVKAEDSEGLLRLQARKDVLFAALKRAVSIFPDAPQAPPAAPQAPDRRAQVEGGGGVNVQGAEVYANHRIHTALLPSGSWIVSLVELGAPTAGARAAGHRVQRLRGEYPSQAEAVAAAKRHIDQRPQAQADGG